MTDLNENDLAAIAVDAAISVHREMGPGLYESVYESCLYYELKKRVLAVARQFPVKVIYNEKVMDVGFKIDLLVENKLILELKAIEALTKIDLAQILNFLKLTDLRLGLLLNFNVVLMKHGIKRVANNL